MQLNAGVSIGLNTALHPKGNVVSVKQKEETVAQELSG